MKKGNYQFNKNLTILVNTKGQILFTKQRQYSNTRYERLRTILKPIAYRDRII